MKNVRTHFLPVNLHSVVRGGVNLVSFVAEVEERLAETKRFANRCSFLSVVLIDHPRDV